jgi:dephospho-CoA kinase
VKQQQYTVGLTGGIASGKSTVANVFRDLGVLVVDADQASREVVKLGSPALKTIHDHFSGSPQGGNILLADGQLNRALLREIIFADKAERDWLEGLLHPLIREWIAQELQSQSAHPYSIIESPLLFETDQHLMVDAVLVIDVTTEIQLQRAISRDRSSLESIRSIIRSQMDRQERCRRADWVFDNTQGPDSIAPRVFDLHQTFVNLAQSTP